MLHCDVLSIVQFARDNAAAQIFHTLSNSGGSSRSLWECWASTCEGHFGSDHAASAADSASFFAVVGA